MRRRGGLTHDLPLLGKTLSRIAGRAPDPCAALFVRRRSGGFGAGAFGDRQGGGAGRVAAPQGDGAGHEIGGGGMTIDLKKFCSKDRPKLLDPFSGGEFTYASNGHIAVRVPRCAEYADNANYAEILGRMIDRFED